MYLTKEIKESSSYGENKYWENDWLARLLSRLPTLAEHFENQMRL
jgi:hypothetical protein